MMSIKKGVKSEFCLTPEILLGLMVARDVYAAYGHSMVITSLADGKHKEDSLHYTGYAADLRTRDLDDSDKKLVAKMLRGCLGDDYDVVLESDHIHMEYDPDE